MATPYALGAIKKPLKPEIPHLAAPSVPVALPLSWSNGDLLPPVFNQGQLGSCTANAACALVECFLKRMGLPVVVGSRLWNYAMARIREHTLPEDAGANIQDNFASLLKDGLPPEIMYPYDDRNPGVFSNDPRKVAGLATEAHKHRGLGPYAVRQDLYHIKNCLYQRNVLEFGMVVYNDMFTAPNGDVQMPRSGDSVAGGHALLCYAYTDDIVSPGGGRFFFQNSWGQGWGNQGHGSIPYAYFTDTSLVFELFTIHSVTS